MEEFDQPRLLYKEHAMLSWPSYSKDCIVSRSAQVFAHSLKNSKTQTVSIQSVAQLSDSDV